MRVTRAVVTAAAPYQRTLPLQTLIDSDGVEKPVLQIIFGHIRAAGVEEIGVIINPDDEAAFRAAAGADARHVVFIPQKEPRGYAQAVYCAKDFTAGAPFLHVVGDHIYVCPADRHCGRAIVSLAEEESCSVSAVQATRETLLKHYGAVAGPRLSGRPNLYRVETVFEKPTPTEAEQRLLVTGLRAGYYLCFFGMHVLTPVVMDILGRMLSDGTRKATFSDALAEVARCEQYLAMLTPGQRFDLGVRYGFLTAQLALSLHGPEATDVISRVLEIVASRETVAAGAAGHE